MQKINNRLAHLRNLMRANKLSAYIVPGTDPHAGEYIADSWKERDWISGFDGSAGICGSDARESRRLGRSLII